MYYEENFNPQLESSVFFFFSTSTSFTGLCSRLSLGKGYLAGLADLHIGAREGNATLVGQACVEEYVKGTADKKSAAGGDPQATGREADCYWAGFYSGI